MKNPSSISELLQWRLSQAEADAPPAPRAALLLEMTRPWWEIWPGQFRALVDRLGRIQAAYGYAMADSRSSGGGFPVPAVVALLDHEFETSVRVLYLSVRDNRLMFRFELNAAGAQLPEHLEATFVAETSQPLMSTMATLSVDAEYRVDTELPAAIAQQWRQLKVMDRMPFRLLLRSNGPID